MNDREFDFSEQVLNDNLKEKILNDLDISNNSDINLQKLVDDATEMRRILHLREKNKKSILDQIEKKIIVDIPSGSEETLMNDLEEFNHNFYGNEDSVFFDFRTQKTNQKKEFSDESKVKNILNNVESLNDTTDKVYEVSSRAQDLLEKERVSDYIKHEDPFYLKNDDVVKENYGDAIHLTSDLIKSDNLEILSDDKTHEIIVDDESDKEKIIDFVEKEIESGKFKFINVQRPLQISGKRIHKKIKSLRQKFITTYGSEIFKKVSDWIVEEQNLYNNLDRIQRIQRYKKNKIKLAKHIQMKEKLKRFFNK